MIEKGMLIYLTVSVGFFVVSFLAMSVLIKTYNELKQIRILLSEEQRESQKRQL